MYIIKKDGLYLMAYQYNGIREFDAKGNYTDIPTGYYSADCCAEEILARLRGGEHPENVKKDGDTYTYACKISETQVLAVRVTVNGTDYKILQWQAVSVAEWNTEDKLPVWDGETP